MREIVTETSLERKFLLYFGTVGLMAMIGPFGTYEELSLSGRLVFWSIMIGGVGFVMHFTIALTLSHSRFRPLPRWVRLAIGAGLAGLPGAAFAIFTDGVFRPQNLHIGSFSRFWMHVSVIGFVFGALEFSIWQDDPPLVKTPRAAPPDPEPAAAPVPAGSLPSGASAPITTPPLVDRLPHTAREAAIVSLSMQDHYVEVVTSNGTHLVLMRFSDALDLLGALPGAQIHRSHWAARHAAKAIKRDGRRHVLTLTDGRTLPVSARYLEDARALLSTNT